MWTLADRSYDDSLAWAKKKVCMPANSGEYFIYHGPGEKNEAGEGLQVTGSDICSETGLYDEAFTANGSDIHQMTVLPVYARELERELNNRDQ